MEGASVHPADNFVDRGRKGCGSGAQGTEGCFFNAEARHDETMSASSSPEAAVLSPTAETRCFIERRIFRHFLARGVSSGQVRAACERGCLVWDGGVRERLPGALAAVLTDHSEMMVVPDVARAQRGSVKTIALAPQRTKACGSPDWASLRHRSRWRALLCDPGWVV